MVISMSIFYYYHTYAPGASSFLPPLQSPSIAGKALLQPERTVIGATERWEEGPLWFLVLQGELVLLSRWIIDAGIKSRTSQWINDANRWFINSKFLWRTRLSTCREGPLRNSCHDSVDTKCPLWFHLKRNIIITLLSYLTTQLPPLHWLLLYKLFSSMSHPSHLRA